MVAYSTDSVNVVVVVAVTAKSNRLAIINTNLDMIALTKICSNLACFHTMVNLGNFHNDVLAYHE
jgi:hypothetical protein